MHRRNFAPSHQPWSRLYMIQHNTSALVIKSYMLYRIVSLGLLPIARAYRQTDRFCWTDGGVLVWRLRLESDTFSACACFIFIDLRGAAWRECGVGGGRGEGAGRKDHRGNTPRTKHRVASPASQPRLQLRRCLRHTEKNQWWRFRGRAGCLTLGGATEMAGRDQWCGCGWVGVGMGV